ncbi:MAG: efflux RND transporter permease subunit [Gammaproteobacteria bacterium]|nr:efflux RND transporter permease subunit [Gammaproteobacteria bacterium]MBQ0840089.1 efflux RND transporter permease subunit [Gammaproteobacteria bacterium]
MSSLGVAGGITRAFIQSALTPLILIVSVILGTMALLSMPQEEDPQITVPFVDIFINTPGLQAEDVVELVTKPFEDILKGIDNVEHVYSMTRDDGIALTVRFDTGFDDDAAVARVNDAIDANRYRVPSDLPPPLVIGRSIDDAAVVVLTLSPKPGNAGRWTSDSLYDLTEELKHEIIKVDDVGLTYIIGGHPKELRIEPDPELLSLYGITLNQVVDKIRHANQSFAAGSLRNTNQLTPVIVGQTLHSTTEIGLLVITTVDGRPVYLRDVAKIVIGASLGEYRVSQLLPVTDDGKSYERLPAVSLAIGKRNGANGVAISEDVLKRLEQVRGGLIPDEINVEITRDYGETAGHKSNEMMLHLILATAAIVLIMGAFLGWREGIVVLLVVPATILLTFFTCWLFDVTLNRLTMYGIIFSIAILADDAIVVIENVSRHWKMLNGRTLLQATIDGVAEVGNPTIIATFTVVIAMLPMLFIHGFIAPFLAPIPIAACAAMIFSLLLAFTVVPWAMLKLHPNAGQHTADHSALDNEKEAQGGIFGAAVRRCMSGLLSTPTRAKYTVLAVVFLTLLTFLIPYYKLVLFKIMPFDDKQDIQIQVDLPEGSTLEATDRILVEASQLIAGIEEIQNMQIYTGVAGPFHFYGLVRQDYLRNSPELGELRIRLSSTWERKRESHDIAMEIKQRLKALQLPENATLELVESPPGPPAPYIVLAEVYGPDAQTRRDTARKIQQAIDQIPALAESDNSLGNPPMRMRIAIDQESLDFHRVDEGAVYGTLAALLQGVNLGHSHRGDGRNPIPIVLREPKESLFLGERLLSTPVPTMDGGIRELGDVVSITREPASFPIYRRDGHFADMVMASIRGEHRDAPMYALYEVEQIINNMDWAGGIKPDVRYFGQPEDESKPTLLWMGEWDVTKETFVELGSAFNYAILGIYILVVGHFSSFKTPLIVLLPVPLGFSGIILGHWIMDATYSMPSTIGLIALSGIVVRNSILLIEFIHMESRKGVPMRTAALEAAAIRSKPIFLTALAGIAGSAFILPDAMLHGMGVALMFGLASSTILTLLVIPAMYVWLRDDGRAV